MTAHPSVDQRRLRSWLCDSVPDVISDDGEVSIFNISSGRFVASVIKGGYIIVGASFPLPNEQQSAIDSLEIIADISVSFPTPKLSVESSEEQPVLFCRVVNYVEPGCNDAQGIAMVQTMITSIFDAFQAFMDRWNEAVKVLI